ncbi:PH domain-containing protein [Salinifilum ghardaiensis]
MAVPVSVVLVALFVVVAVMLRETPTGVYFRVSDQVSMALLGVLLGAAALVPTLPRLRADRSGVEVRNAFISKHHPWSEVRGITFPEGAAWARVELPDDEYTPVMAIQATDGEHAVVAMRRLRELRRTAEAERGAEQREQDPQDPDADAGHRSPSEQQDSES